VIPYVREIQFEYGRSDQVSPLIRRVVADNPGPFTYVGTGTYIVGSGEVAVIDPGPADDRHLAALLRAIEGERLTHILVTHSHLDHSPLSRPLQAAARGAIYGRSAREHAPVGHDTEEGDDAVFRPDVEVEEGQVFSGSGWTVEAIATPGHASNHVAYALREENALFSGDHVMGWSTTVVTPPDGDMGDYLSSLQRVRERGFDTLWPTHGPPITEVAPFLDAYRDHRLQREAQVLAQLAAGRSRIKEMVPELYAAVDRRLWPAASMSVWAHLLHLVRTGRVEADGEAGLDSAYRLSARRG
jgi:glyoxylase-like metal-dependent hydrolase (beta-lactamase superfamily II)